MNPDTVRGETIVMPAEIDPRKNFQGEKLGCLVGFEPTSSGATVRRSTAELQAPRRELQSLIIAFENDDA